jgi:hypothetical protein
MIEKIVQPLVWKELTSLFRVNDSAIHRIRRLCSEAKSPVCLDCQQFAVVTRQDALRLLGASFRKIAEKAGAGGSAILCLPIHPVALC